MARIYLRGGLNYEVSNFKAQDVKEAWLGKKDIIIDLGAISFKVAEIKSIQLDEEIQRADTYKYLNEDKAWKFEFRAKSLEVIARQTMSFVKLLFHLAHKAVDETQIMNILVGFFEQNPNRCFPDLSLFNSELNNYHFLLNRVEERVFDSLIRTVQNDAKDAKYIGENKQIALSEGNWHQEIANMF